MTTRHPRASLRALTLTALAIAAAGPALAQDTPYYLVGVGIGQARGQFDEGRITAGQLGAGLSTTGISRDLNDTTYKFFGGYQFNRNIGLELGFFNLGKFKFQSTTAPAGQLNSELRVQGVNLDLVGSLPVTDNFSVLARLGGQYAKTRDHFTGSGAVTPLNPNPGKRELNGKVGLGLQYAFSPSVLARAEGERYRVSDAVGGHGYVNAMTVSLVFPFGQAPTARRVSTAPIYSAPAPMSMPAPVAAAPAPAPVVVVVTPAPAAPVAPPPERRRVSFSADSLFGFDKSAVQPEGKLALDKFAQEIRGTQYDKISVEGHTDRLGSTAYNQTLSQQRADAVKSYLVSNDGLDAGKINASGKSESTPVTKPDDCKGNAPSAKLIACLQPDRRVEVEVTALR